MEYSLSAWIGALAGTVVAVALYVPGIRWMERQIRVRGGPATPVEREELETRLSIVRRLIWEIGIAILATLGYWIGAAFGGTAPFQPLG